MDGADARWRRLRGFTPARIALGRAGTGLPTAALLDFAMAHAQARDAVHLALDAPTLGAGLAALGLPVVPVASRAPDRAVYLRRPDLGRRLDPAARERLTAARAVYDLALVVADGLSARAVHANAVAVLEAFLPYARAAGWSLAPLVVAHQARVALGDEVAVALGARAVCVLIGERPGLSSPDSLGLYLTLDPRIGTPDAARNCISNVREAGLAPAAAAFKLDWLLRQAFARGLTGVALKDESDAALAGPAADPTLLAPGAPG
jgi:ethanolamine ammonia-lyase small subunit